MRKRELLKFLNDKIESDFGEAQSDMFDGIKVLKSGINIMVSNYFIEAVKKQKAFYLKLSLDEFKEIYSEALENISSDFSEHMDALVDSEASIGISILVDDIKQSRIKK